MAKKSRDTGKVDNDLKKRLRANMKAKREDRKCYAFGMAINPKMKPVLCVPVMYSSGCGPHWAPRTHVVASGRTQQGGVLRQDRATLPARA